VLGGILAGYGLVTAGDAEMYARSTSLNLNLWWGLVMIGFGALMLALAARAARRAGRIGVRPAEETPAGPERREHELGLEQ